jgi:hypothetical protein
MQLPPALHFGGLFIMEIPLTAICKRCDNTFQPKRLAQAYCSAHCRDADAKQRKRANKSMDARERGIPVARSLDIAPSTAPTGPIGPPKPEPWTTNFTEVLQGDDYPLEYDANGYPELPAFLDRKQKALKEAA